MIHKPIQFKDLSLSFPHKTCFDDFNVQINSGDRIAVIGRNGSGKSMLLKMVRTAVENINDITAAYIPQIINDFNSLSGGQRFNASLTEALSSDPTVLLLDEPTNHLDRQNRKSLMRMLQSYRGTLIVVSHDTELLRSCIDTLWHIDRGKIHVFSGSYDNYVRERNHQKASLEQEVAHLNREKKEIHRALMKEQKRAAKSKAQGAKSIDRRKWPTIVSHAKAGRAEETSGRKKSAIDHERQDLNEKLSILRLPEIIQPKFSLSHEEVKDGVVLSVHEGAIGYHGSERLISNINLSLFSKGRLAITGGNGSGKTTIVRAILGDPIVERVGDWYVPKNQNIGYLDQHYKTLSSNKSVLESLSEVMPSWSPGEVRRHLNDFLFRKNEEVNTFVYQLSGGEKARLSLALIAAKPPKLLILDEITNNLDLETRNHVVEVLKDYPGTMIVISHETDFLTEIGVHNFYEVGKDAR